jgi:type II secretion system protein G
MRAHRQRGMTLIEIMIVIAIIGLVMAVVAFNVTDSQDKARVKLARADLFKMRMAYAQWSSDDAGEAECPDSLQVLARYMGRPPGERLLDPWTQAYLMRCGQLAPPDCGETFCALSKGKDRRVDTDDDVLSWSREPRQH